MSTDRKPQYLLTNQDANLLVAANTARAVVVDGDFVLKVYSETDAFDSGTVNVYIMSPEGVPVLLQAFTEAGAKFGRVGQIPQVFKAELVDTAGGAADVTVTIEN